MSESLSAQKSVRSPEEIRHARKTAFFFSGLFGVLAVLGVANGVKHEVNTLEVPVVAEQISTISDSQKAELQSWVDSETSSRDAMLKVGAGAYIASMIALGAAGLENRALRKATESNTASSTNVQLETL